MRLGCRISMLCLMAVGCFGQQTAEVSGSPSTAVFKSSTSLVQVPVVVRDASGHAVGTLQAEDFQLSDGGKPQVISRFSVEKFGTTEITHAHAKSPDSKGTETAASGTGDAAPAMAAGALPD